MTASAVLDQRGTEWIELYRDAWKAQDLDRLLEPLLPECFVFYPPMPEPTNRAGLRAFYEWVWSTMPDFYITPETWAQDGDRMLIQWSAKGTLQGEHLDWEGCDRFTFRDDGRIVEARAYWDPRHVLDRARELVGITL